MGQWRILIEGAGPHHGSDPVQHPDDAEKLALAFVAELQSHGQSISEASFQRLIPDPRIEGLQPLGSIIGRMDAGAAARWERRVASRDEGEKP